MSVTSCLLNMPQRTRYLQVSYTCTKAAVILNSSTNIWICFGWSGSSSSWCSSRFSFLCRWKQSSQRNLKFNNHLTLCLLSWKNKPVSGSMNRTSSHVVIKIFLCLRFRNWPVNVLVWISETFKSLSSFTAKRLEINKITFPASSLMLWNEFCLHVYYRSLVNFLFLDHFAESKVRSKIQTCNLSVRWRKIYQLIAKRKVMRQRVIFLNVQLSLLQFQNKTHRNVQLCPPGGGIRL